MLASIDWKSLEVAPSGLPVVRRPRFQSLGRLDCEGDDDESAKDEDEEKRDDDDDDDFDDADTSAAEPLETLEDFDEDDFDDDFDDDFEEEWEDEIDDDVTGSELEEPSDLAD